MIHNHSGKIADLSTVRKSTQPHNLTVSAQRLFKTQKVLLLYNCYNTCLAWELLLSQRLKTPSTTQGSPRRKKKEAQKYSVCPSQKLCFDLRNPYNFVNKYTCTHTHTIMWLKEILSLYLKGTLHSLVLQSVVWEYRCFFFSCTFYHIFQMAI